MEKGLAPLLTYIYPLTSASYKAISIWDLHQKILPEPLNAGRPSHSILTIFPLFGV